MHHRDKYKKNRQAKNLGLTHDFPFWKVVFAGWLIRFPFAIIKFFLGLILLTGIIGITLIPDEVIENWQGQNTPQRSY